MEKKFADIIVEISHEKLDKTFQYKIPENLKGSISSGTRVWIPFGGQNKLIQGYVLECTDIPAFDVHKLKEIDSIVTGQVSAESNILKLAAWMKEQYGSTMIQALKMVLPVKQTVKGLVKRSVVLKVSKEELTALTEVFRKKNQTARLRLSEELMKNEMLSYSLVTEKLGISSATIRFMQDKGWIEIQEESLYRNPVKQNDRFSQNIVLSDEQQETVDGIIRDYDQNGIKRNLIHGITGSGKTLVYIHLIQEMIARGKQAIVLIPEIALTYQTVKRFEEAFGKRVTIVNSKLSPGEKYDQFIRAGKDEVDVVIGPRSALFVPFKNLGMIIIDEEHESSYKSENMPKYHAREVAFELAGYYGASVVLGSATPSMEAYRMCEQGIMKKYTLTKRLTGGMLPKVYIEDLRAELKAGNRTIFSRRLHDLMEDRLDKGEQIMLFLNRRGYAGFVSCRSCGEVMKCPHCDISLSEHRNGTLVCHYCGYVQNKPSNCPKCGSRYLTGFKAGTQQIEEALWREFPTHKTLRMDGDTTKKKESYEEILSAFSNHEADILIGTQMIVKGHDFPNVTLVGILAADLSLHAGDFRAGERTFQLLMQAAGRAGRGKIPGEVVIQTYQPENHYITYAAEQNYEAFYAEEIGYRSLMNYPPSTHMLALQILSEEEAEGRKLIEVLTMGIRKQFDKVNIIGPAPATVGKLKDWYRFVTYCRDEKKDVLIQVKNVVELMVSEIPHKKQYIQFDFDPMNL